jgi:hypothetical protein
LRAFEEFVRTVMTHRGYRSRADPLGSAPMIVASIHPQASSSQQLLALPARSSQAKGI